MNDSPVDCQSRGVTEPQRDGGTTSVVTEGLIGISSDFTQTPQSRASRDSSPFYGSPWSFIRFRTKQNHASPFCKRRRESFHIYTVNQTVCDTVRVSLILIKQKGHRSDVLQPGADDGARTRYLHLGKVALYQMSYIRKSESRINDFLLVPSVGIEPTTRGFSVLCSTN